MRHFSSSVEDTGILTVEVKNSQGQTISTKSYKNLVVKAGRNLIRDLLSLYPGVTGITHFAIGTGTTKQAESDVKLVNEVHRGGITKASPSDCQCIWQYYLDTATANDEVITEAGLFGGTATDTADSGSLYCRVKLDEGIEKTSDISITFSWVHTWRAD